MKMKSTLKAFLLMSVLVLFTCSVNAQTFTLSSAGLGPIKKGAVLSRLPSKVEGLYDKVQSKVIEDDYDGNSTEYVFTLKGVKTFMISDYGHGFTVAAFANNIVTKEGIHPQMNIKDLLLKKGLEVHGHMIALMLGEATIHAEFSQIGNDRYNKAYQSVDFEALDKTLSAKDFVPNAKIVSLEVWVGDR